MDFKDMKTYPYLKEAKAAARRTGYDPDKLSVATNGIHKLQYDSPEGIKRFGRLGYGDFHIYSKQDPALAKQKRHVFRQSHGKISEIHKLGKYSPNELAINILW
jgi:hypothetical protein